MRGHAREGHGRRSALVAVGALAVLVAGGCRSEDFQNAPRPPAPVQLTGVITDQRVTVSPNQVGTGPIVIIVSNQTDRSRTVSLVGNGVNEVVGPINPLDTATLQYTLRRPGTYRVRAGSEVATSKQLGAARLIVGAGRQSSRDEIQLP
ncbi:MAG: hypothetical protein ACR2NV_08975 [Thermoleophilaceae bacterium]|jgi:hypothetical protein